MHVSTVQTMTALYPAISSSWESNHMTARARVIFFPSLFSKSQTPYQAQAERRWWHINGATSNISSWRYLTIHSPILNGVFLDLNHSALGFIVQSGGFLKADIHSGDHSSPWEDFFGKKQSEWPELLQRGIFLPPWWFSVTCAPTVSLQMKNTKVQGTCRYHSSFLNAFLVSWQENWSWPTMSLEDELQRTGFLCLLKKVSRDVASNNVQPFPPSPCLSPFLPFFLCTKSRWPCSLWNRFPPSNAFSSISRELSLRSARLCHNNHKTAFFPFTSHMAHIDTKHWGKKACDDWGKNIK